MEKKVRVFFTLLFAAVAMMFLVVGCAQKAEQQQTQPQPQPRTQEPKVKGTLLMATTTSTADTGILDVLNAKFEKDYGWKVKFFAVGSGEALKMGQKGDVDVLLVHSPDDEKKFMADGFGLTRKPVMHNDFVIVGPASDPASIKGMKAAKAFTAIEKKGAIFISRGDDSGTNKKELKIWKKAGITPKGSWYIETGQGMAETLRIADEKQGYTLADRGTHLVTKTNLKILVEKDKPLLNFYSVIVVNPNKFPKVNQKAAEDFSTFITSPEVREMIAGYGVEKYGQPLFVPDAK